MKKWTHKELLNLVEWIEEKEERIRELEEALGHAKRVLEVTGEGEGLNLMMHELLEEIRSLLSEKALRNEKQETE